LKEKNQIFVKIGMGKTSKQQNSDQKKVENKTAIFKTTRMWGTMR